MVADLLSPNCCHKKIAKVKNYNFNGTEIRDSDFKNAFPGIFNFTVGILFPGWDQGSTYLGLPLKNSISVVKMKTYYRAELSKIEDQEQEQLAEIQRWVNFWKLQLSEIKACFED